LQEHLKVPVGFIHTSWGGTRIETWMSPKALQAAGTYEPEPTKGVNANTASALYNGMIQPLLNYRARGAVWYQGESNAGRAYKYRTLFPGMIESWRTEWNNPDLAFFWVQLAPFGAVQKMPGESDWAELREAQTMALKLKNTGQAVITDFGNEYDIHPTPKRPVGDRLALVARALTYGEKIAYSGPLYKSVKFAGNKAILSFDHVGSGLVAKELVPTKENAKGQSAWRTKDNTPGAGLIGFTVCGKDHQFQPAKAEIAGNAVVVTSELVDAPIAVRYGWANHPLCNLFNREGLPASPFRTDDFPGKTQQK
jgi:sialate O-acetylesterase